MASNDDSVLDPVSLEVLWARLVAVVNEQAAALMATSFTPLVRDIGDLSAAVFDERGRMLAQAVTGTPGHINGLATGMKHILAEMPPSTLRPGDVLITNDPWMTTGQLNDISVVTPVFVEDGALVGFLGNCCHAIDIGGRGLSMEGRDVFEEGLQIPITKFYDRGRENRDLVRLIEANVRAPREVLGDLRAQVAANEVGGQQLSQYLADFGLSDLMSLGTEIIDRSEQAMRAAIRALPDGEYVHARVADGVDAPIKVATTLVVDDDEITVSLAGSSPQVDRGLNVVLNYATAYTHYALKCVLCPDVPHNDGSFRPITVTAPEGSIFNPRYPAAVAGRHIPGHVIPHALFGALARIVPNRVLAEGAGAVWLCTVRGCERERYVSVFFAAGGMGARPTSDGLNTTGFPSGVATAAAEVIERTGPLIFRRKELRRDSGGAGKHRGGLGQKIEIELRSAEKAIVSLLGDRFTNEAEGFAGGGPGALGAFRATGGVRNPQQSIVLPPGGRITLELPGGAGFHDPLTRPGELVAQDIAEGLVSRAAAKRLYGWDGDSARTQR